MTSEHLIGSRIRERRIDRGIRQADMAQEAGISPSYLNLIEHNKRRIGGQLLTRLAAILEIDAATLATGADATLLDGMRAAAARFETPAEVGRAEDFAARFPGWADLVAAQELQLGALEQEVHALTDRITHDPAMADALHNVISAVTAIRATAGILVSGERIDADWQRRFHVNLDNDSRRLTDDSKTLVAYLEAPNADAADRTGGSVFDQVETCLAGADDVLQAISSEAQFDTPALMAMLSADGLRTDARAALENLLDQMCADARALPEGLLIDAFDATSGNPAAIASQVDLPLEVVLRRLGRLPAALGLPPMGLAICDGAGVLTHLRPVPGFSLNRRTPPCPLWPLFTALTQVMRPLCTYVALPDPANTRLLCYAIATATPSDNFNTPPRVQSTMLMVADPEPGPADPLRVGSSCRICPRVGCSARREASVIDTSRP